MDKNADNDEEHEWARQVKQTYEKLVSLFENEMLPLLDANRELNSNDFWASVRKYTAEG